MSLPNGTARLAPFFAPLAALACGLAAGEAHAAPIPTQITYSTSGPEPLRSSAGDVVFEFRPVTDGVATVGTELKLGTILIHHQEAGTGYMFPGVMFPISLRVSKVHDATVPLGEREIGIQNSLFGTVREDGKIDGTFIPFFEVGDQKGPFQIGGVSLTLTPVKAAPLWNIDDSTPVVGVDVFARIDATPVPEPGLLLIFAAASGLGLHRLRLSKARSS